MIDLVLSAQEASARTTAHPMLRAYFQILEAAAEKIPGGTADSVCTKRIGVTSLHRGAGVSTLAANIAIAAAKLGHHQVTLLEANRYRPSLRKNFANVGKLGFTDVLKGTCEPEEAVYAADDGLSLVPVGKGLRASKLARFPEMAVNSTVAELEQDSDWLLVDLPVVGKQLNTSISMLLDGVILLVQVKRVTSVQLDRVKRHYQSCGVPILGTVFRRKFQS
jgi:MinD-like ATPase involved in chromosome partitioning or flagellar assembly